MNQGANEGTRGGLVEERVGREDHDPLSEIVIGAAIEVHRTLGPGFLENVYEEALCLELTALKVPFVRQHRVCLEYKGIEIGDARLDLIVADALVVELKAIDSFAPIHRAQLLSHLKATRLKRGLLINFNTPVLKDGLKRISL